MKANLVSKTWENSKDSVPNKYCGNAAEMQEWFFGEKNCDEVVI